MHVLYEMRVVLEVQDPHLGRFFLRPASNDATARRLAHMKSGEHPISSGFLSRPMPATCVEQWHWAANWSEHPSFQAGLGDVSSTDHEGSEIAGSAVCTEPSGPESVVEVSVAQFVPKRPPAQFLPGIRLCNYRDRRFLPITSPQSPSPKLLPSMLP